MILHLSTAPLSHCLARWCMGEPGGKQLPPNSQQAYQVYTLPACQISGLSGSTTSRCVQPQRRASTRRMPSSSRAAVRRGSLSSDLTGPQVREQGAEGFVCRARWVRMVGLGLACFPPLWLWRRQLHAGQPSCQRVTGFRSLRIPQNAVPRPELLHPVCSLLR